jgi:hypothetical protein
MKTLRYSLIGFAWLPILALAAWWAGFMPFPTRPVELGSQSINNDGFATRKEFHLIISASKARFGLNSWDCFPDKNRCRLYSVREVPFYGLTNPRWVLTAYTDTSGAVGVALYGTYAACKWNEDHKQKDSEDIRVNFERWATEQHQKIESQERELFSCVKTPE